MRRGILLGAALAILAAAITVAYLSWITIDDGLEALIFVPIVGVLFISAGAFGGRRGRTWNWVMGQSLGFAVVVTLVLLVPFVVAIVFDWSNMRTGGPFLREPWTYGTIMVVSTISTVGTITGCTTACATVGWLTGSSLRRRGLRRLPAPPPGTQA